MERGDADITDRSRLLGLIARRYSQSSAFVRPRLDWKDPVEWGRLALQENIHSKMFDRATERWEFLTRHTGRTVRSLITTRLASEQGGVLHLTLGKRWSCDRYLELLGSLPPAPKWRSGAIYTIEPEDVEPLQPAHPPRGDVVFTSPADIYRDQSVRGRSFQAVVADHMAIDTIFADPELWQPKSFERYHNETLWASLASINTSPGVADSLGRSWEPGMSFTLPGRQSVGLVTDTITYVGIVIGLAALYEGQPVPLCPETCDLLEPRD